MYGPAERGPVVVPVRAPSNVHSTASADKTGSVEWGIL